MTGWGTPSGGGRPAVADGTFSTLFASAFCALTADVRRPAAARDEFLTDFTRLLCALTADVCRPAVARDEFSTNFDGKFPATRASGAPHG